MVILVDKQPVTVTKDEFRQALADLVATERLSVLTMFYNDVRLSDPEVRDAICSALLERLEIVARSGKVTELLADIFESDLTDPKVRTAWEEAAIEGFQVALRTAQSRNLLAFRQMKSEGSGPNLSDKVQAALDQAISTQVQPRSPYETVSGYLEARADRSMPKAEVVGALGRSDLKRPRAKPGRARTG